MADAKTSTQQPQQSPVSQFLRKLFKDRKTQILIAIILVGLIAAYLIFVLFIRTPVQQGSWRYAACRTFIELHHEYPQTIDIFAAADRASDVTIFYNVHNAFGAIEVNNMYCAFSQNARSGRPVLSRLEINGEPIDRDTMNKFSFTIPYIIYSNPSAALPPPLKAPLSEIKARKPFRIEVQGAE